MAIIILVVLGFTLICGLLQMGAEKSGANNPDHLVEKALKENPERDMSKAKLIDTNNNYASLLMAQSNDFTVVDFNDEDKTITLTMPGSDRKRKFSYNDILSFEVIKDGASVYSPSVTGFVGMGVAAPKHQSKTINDWRIQIRINDFNNSVANILLVNKKCEIKSDLGFEVKTKQESEIISTLQYAMSHRDNSQQATA